MAKYASDCNTAERGPPRVDTLETLVAKPSVAASSSSRPVDTKLTPGRGNADPSTIAIDVPMVPDWTKVPRHGDVTRYPKGYPRLGVQQTQGHNCSVHRRFEPEGELLITHWEYKVALAAQKLHKWYHSHPEACRCTPGRYEQVLPIAAVDEYNALIEELDHAWSRYHTLMMAQKEKRTLLNVHWKEVRGLYGTFLASQGVTDEEAFLPAYAPVDDFCTTALRQEHLPVRNLLFSSFVQRLQRRVPILKFSEESGGFQLSMRALSLVLEIFRIFFTSSLLLIPIAIMLFGGLDTRSMFGTLLAFVFLFTTAMVLGRGVGTGEPGGGSGHGSGLLHGVVAAYTAVLGTFLAQLGG